MDTTINTTQAAARREAIYEKHLVRSRSYEELKKKAGITLVQLSYIRETNLSPLITPPDSMYCEAYRFCDAYADEDDYDSFLTKTLHHFVATSGADKGGEYHTPTQHEIVEHLMAYFIEHKMSYYIEYLGEDTSQEYIDGIREAMQLVIAKQYPAFCKEFKEKADFDVYIANGGEFVF